MSNATTLVPALPAALYVVATPLGNLADITLRALTVLQGVDVILCEDTRTSLKLLQHYQINKPLLAYHDHNEAAMAANIVGRLQAGERVALISDAGMPLIADPGYRLVRACHAAAIPITVIPGACAAVSALALSGFSGNGFYFAGFAPSKAKARESFIGALRPIVTPIIFYEAPIRLLDLLEALHISWGNRDACVARELTKKFEEVLRAPLTELMLTLKQRPEILGECVVVVDGCRDSAALDDKTIAALKSLLPHMAGKHAAQIIGDLTGLPRQVLYEAATALK